MQSRIDDAMIFARANFAAADAGPVDLRRIVERAVADRADAGDAVNLAQPPAAIMVRGSDLALGRVVGNLLDNAIKYPGTAEVSLAQDADQALVLDRGPGVPAAEREQLFEPFYRMEASRNREQDGAGLGLAIAKHVVGSLGGRIGVVDRAGGGTCFWIRQPIRA